MQTTEVELAKLSPSPYGRQYADPTNVARLGPFDWNKYQPIWVERDGTQLIIMDGMTRVEIALQAGLTKLPAYVFPKSGAP
jgi:hypothetical protein